MNLLNISPQATRITVLLDQVEAFRLNANTAILFRVGSESGLLTSGYRATWTKALDYFRTPNYFFLGFGFGGSAPVNGYFSGAITFSRFPNSNKWAVVGSYDQFTANGTFELPSVLTQISFTTAIADNFNQQPDLAAEPFFGGTISFLVE